MAFRQPATQRVPLLQWKQSGAGGNSVFGYYALDKFQGE
jgi:hypothetical protein